jgi:hypothetical protein
MGLDMSRIWYCVRAGILCWIDSHGDDGRCRQSRSGDGKDDEGSKSVMSRYVSHELTRYRDMELTDGSGSCTPQLLDDGLA